jgi:hypothetical protein
LYFEVQIEVQKMVLQIEVQKIDGPYSSSLFEPGRLLLNATWPPLLRRLAGALASPAAMLRAVAGTVTARGQPLAIGTSDN